MTFRLKLTLAAVVIITGVTGAVLARHFKDKSRQARYEGILAQYSKEIPSGATRAQIEQFVRAHGAQPEADKQVVGPDYHDIMVKLGDSPPPFYCSGVVVYLRLEFDASDKYTGASLKPEPWDCM